MTMDDDQALKAPHACSVGLQSVALVKSRTLGSSRRPGLDMKRLGESWHGQWHGSVLVATSKFGGDQMIPDKSMQRHPVVPSQKVRLDPPNLRYIIIVSPFTFLRRYLDP